MLTRGLAVWLVLLALAICNGAMREKLLLPRIGEAAGHAVSSILLSAAIVTLTWFTISWIRPLSPAEAWQLGILWLGLTLAFEFLVGHYVMAQSWDRLLGDYNVARGRLWVLVLLTTMSAPPLLARVQALFP
jgi:hypothetical protein